MNRAGRWTKPELLAHGAVEWDWPAVFDGEAAVVWESYTQSGRRLAIHLAWRDASRWRYARPLQLPATTTDFSNPEVVLSRSGTGFVAFTSHRAGDTAYYVQRAALVGHHRFGRVLDLGPGGDLHVCAAPNVGGGIVFAAPPSPSNPSDVRYSRFGPDGGLRGTRLIARGGIFPDCAINAMGDTMLAWCSFPTRANAGPQATTEFRRANGDWQAPTVLSPATYSVVAIHVGLGDNRAATVAWLAAPVGQTDNGVYAAGRGPDGTWGQTATLADGLSDEPSVADDQAGHGSVVFPYRGHIVAADYTPSRRRL